MLAQRAQTSMYFSYRRQAGRRVQCRDSAGRPLPDCPIATAGGRCGERGSYTAPWWWWPAAAASALSAKAPNRSHKPPLEQQGAPRCLGLIVT